MTWARRCSGSSPGSSRRWRGSGNRYTRIDASAKYAVKHHSVQARRHAVAILVAFYRSTPAYDWQARPTAELIGSWCRSPPGNSRRRPANWGAHINRRRARAYHNPERARGGFKGTGAVGSTGGLPGRHRHCSSCWTGANRDQAAEAPA